MKERLTLYQQRVAQYGIIQRFPYKTADNHNTESHFTIADCLRLGVLFVRTQGRVPYARDMRRMNMLPSQHTILSIFNTVGRYQKCLRELCENPLHS